MHLTKYTGILRSTGLAGQSSRQLYRSFLAEILENPGVTGESAPRTSAAWRNVPHSGHVASAQRSVSAWSSFALQLKAAVDKWETEMHPPPKLQ